MAECECRRCGMDGGEWVPLATLDLCPRCKCVFDALIGAAKNEFWKSCEVK